jgi:hypothetical protein
MRPGIRASMMRRGLLCEAEKLPSSVGGHQPLEQTCLVYPQISINKSKVGQNPMNE